MLEWNASSDSRRKAEDTAIIVPIFLHNRLQDHIAIS